MRTGGGNSGHQKARPTAYVTAAHPGSAPLLPTARAKRIAPIARTSNPSSKTSTAAPR